MYMRPNRLYPITTKRSGLPGFRILLSGKLNDQIKYFWSKHGMPGGSMVMQPQFRNGEVVLKCAIFPPPWAQDISRAIDKSHAEINTLKENSKNEN
jgi:hypothetical protein